MTDPTNNIDALLCDLGYAASIGHQPWRHAVLTALVAERDGLAKRVAELERELAAANSQLVSKADELAAMQKQRDEAHGLIRKWRLNLVDVVEVGDYMDAMTSESRIGMNDADKRAFLAATVKEWGGA